VLPYFGDGDEFQMAFNFPVMPRLYMGLRREDPTPIINIIEQLPAIPENAQWCTFLRNHDELTLEMVTEEERSYMYSEYAKEPRMRLNLGIRRRLAPLLENDRRRIEILNAILFSLPGSPIIYYGDEIGMGDNIYLFDRNGVRTPMQWNIDRSAGFSKANPARLYAPVINDTVFGYMGVNVEAQQQAPASLLNWMKRLIQVQKSYPAFGLGGIRFCTPENSTVLAYVRSWENQHMLCVNNLSAGAQYVELQLADYAGFTPVDVFGGQPFPKIGSSPYLLTLAPYAFYWFELRK
jgi:maltose alpha-D-glucosyltransferase/alpha-amylase